MNHEDAPKASLHHIALGARDVEGVAAFYHRIFALPELTRHYERDGALRSIWLELRGGTLLMIERCAASKPHAQGVAPGPFLLAFATTPDERQRLEARLEAAGAAIEGRTAFSSYARDPEGNRVAISHWPQES